MMTMKNATAILADTPPAYVLGTMAMTGYYGPSTESQALRTLDFYLEQGGRWIDTADLYANGGNETLVGKAIAARRKDVVLCTKFGYLFGERADQRGLDARPERVEAACDASLRRLGTDVIDLFYLHRVDPNVPIEETYGAMARLVEKGKARALGLCEVGPQAYARAAALHPVAVVQSEYSLWSREPETDIIPVLREHGSWFFGYASLGRGILSGTLKSPDDLPPGDQRRDMPRFQGENFYKNLALVDMLKDMAADAGVNAAQLALAWCRRHGDATPIVGVTEEQHVRDAQRAISLDIAPALWQRLDEIFAPGAAAGLRYPASAMKRLESGR